MIEYLTERNIPRDAAEFMTRIWEPNPDLRASFQELLEDPFLEGHVPDYPDDPVIFLNPTPEIKIDEKKLEYRSVVLEWMVECALQVGTDVGAPPLLFNSFVLFDLVASQYPLEKWQNLASVCMYISSRLFYDIDYLDKYYTQRKMVYLNALPLTKENLKKYNDLVMEVIQKLDNKLLYATPFDYWQNRVDGLNIRIVLYDLIMAYVTGDVYSYSPEEYEKVQEVIQAKLKDDDKSFENVREKVVTHILQWDKKVQAKFGFDAEWTVYTKEGCPYCEKAVALLKEKGKKVIVKEGAKNMKLVEKEMKRVGREEFKTWPKIFKGRKFIGGYSDLQNLKII